MDKYCGRLTPGTSLKGDLQRAAPLRLSEGRSRRDRVLAHSCGTHTMFPTRSLRDRPRVLPPVHSPVARLRVATERARTAAAKLPSAHYVSTLRGCVGSYRFIHFVEQPRTQLVDEVHKVAGWNEVDLRSIPEGQIL